MLALSCVDVNEQCWFLFNDICLGRVRWSLPVDSVQEKISLLEAGISRLEHPKMAEAFAGKQLRWLITQRPVWATGIRHMRCRDWLCPPPPVCKDCIALVKSHSRSLFRLQCMQVIWYKYGERLFRIHGEMSLSLKKCLYLSKHAWI